MYWLMSALLVALAIIFGDGYLVPGLTVMLLAVGPLGERLTGSDSFVTPKLFELIRSSFAALVLTAVAFVSVCAIVAGFMMFDSSRRTLELILLLGIVAVAWAWAMKGIYLKKGATESSN